MRDSRYAWGLCVLLVGTGCSSDSGSDANGGQGGSGAKGGGGGTGAGGGSGGGSAGVPVTPSCNAAANGSSGPVQAPTLRSTLDASWDENWLAAPALADVDGDGKLDIVAARHSVLYVWRGDGSKLWQTAWASSASNSPEHGSSRMWASPVVADFDGDGKVEIAVGSDADSSSNVNVAVYDNKGELMPGWPVHFGASDEVRSIAAADVDGDGKLEVLVNKTNKGPTTAVYELDGSMHPGFPQVSAACNPAPPAEECWDFGGYNQNIAAGDLDGDGVDDVVSSYDAIGFGVFKGDGTPFPTHASFTDKVITAVEAYHELKLSQQGWGTGDRSEFTYSPPVIADIDGDGDREIVLAGDHEHSSDTTNKGITVWVLNHDMTRPQGWDPPKDTGLPIQTGSLGANIVATRPNPTVAELDGKPGLEILVPTYDGKLHCFGPTGNELWSYTFGSSPSPYTGAGEALVVDLNGDGAPEILFTTFSSGQPKQPDAPAHLVVLDAAGKQLHKIELFGRGSMAAPSVADLDGDGQLELVISLKDTLGGAKGGVQIWDLPGSSDNCVLWGTGRGGLRRQGYVP
ncbi:MAG: VCBS repeat-containing protein [Polyangiaceae bacterium]